MDSNKKGMISDKVAVMYPNKMTFKAPWLHCVHLVVIHFISFSFSKIVIT